MPGSFKELCHFLNESHDKLLQSLFFRQYILHILSPFSEYISPRDRVRKSQRSKKKKNHNKHNKSPNLYRLILTFYIIDKVKLINLRIILNKVDIILLPLSNLNGPGKVFSLETAKEKGKELKEAS